MILTQNKGFFMHTIQAGFSSPNSKIAIIVARFNYFTNKFLITGTIDILKRIGHIDDDNITIIKIPGAYELPLIVNNAAISKKFNAIITLGTVIKGETIHFKNIVTTVNKLLSKISIEQNIPITSGILMTENIQQAIERCGGKKGNKGCEAAYVTLEMLNIINKIN